ncbi:MAG: lysophospholipid acyltransferase family protein, partial [Deltaproteobacteria bacterium]|nr:lysophospholipid acyltransferase family protein [Deltaproteobacteria bacterium]
HQFWTDIPIVGLAAGKPLYFIAKQELFRYPGVTQFMRLLGAIPLDRIKPIKSLKTFRSVNHLLKNSEFIVLFPEGTYYPYSLGQGKYRFIENILRFQENQKWFGEKAISFLPMGIAYEKKGLRPQVKVKIGAPLFSNGKVDGPEFTRRLINEIGKLSELT